MSTRGIRNCNPANIRKGDKWLGMSKEQKDKAFVQFSSMEWGVRALIITLRTYVVKHHLYSVNEIIHRWAPPSDGNNTGAYIVYVSKCLSDMKISPYVRFYSSTFRHDNVADSYSLFALCKAMCMIESQYTLTIEMYQCAARMI